MKTTGSFHEKMEDAPEGICPFLGLEDDSRTALSYPSSWNMCHHARPMASPNLDYQQTYCLKNAYTTCPVFLRKEGAALPADIRAPLDKAWRPRPRVLWVALLVSIVLLGIAGGIWAFKGTARGSHALSTLTASAMSIGDLTPSWTPSLSATDTFLVPGVTIFPTDTQIPPTPTASVAKVTPKGEKVNCRFGPGTSYSMISELRVGVIVPILGGNAERTWWQIEDPIGDEGVCWVSDAVVDVSGDLSSVPVVAAPPLPPTGSPTNTPPPSTFTPEPTDIPVPSDTPLPPTDTPTELPTPP